MNFFESHGVQFHAPGSILLLGMVFCTAGCDLSPSPCPELPAVYPFEYVSQLTLPADRDSVLMMVNYNPGVPMGIDRPVFMDSRISVDDSLRLSLLLIGETYPQRFPPLPAPKPGVVDYRWSDDTLRVWCGMQLPQSWEGGSSMEKCTPDEPWITPARIDVVLPEGVGFRYIRQHSNWH